MHKKQKGTPLLKALLFEKRLPWRYKKPFIRQYESYKKFYNEYRIIEGIRFRFPDYLIRRNLNKPLLKFKPLPKYEKENITVIIGVKDRFDNRIINALESIRYQDYPTDLINITIVDYDSKEELIPKFKNLCKKYNAKYIRINNQPVWNRGHCQNIGIKRAKTKYVLTSDTDIIFEKNYIRESINELKKNPNQIILGFCFFLPDTPIEKFDFKKFKHLANKPKKNQGLAKGISLTLTYFHHKINGYDEQFKMGGWEDLDLIKRLVINGLNIKGLKDKTYFLHQWHPRHEEAKKIKGYKEQIERNWQYLMINHSIIRNKNGWGEIEFKR